MSIRKLRYTASDAKKCRSRSSRSNRYPSSTSSSTTRASSSSHIARVWSGVRPRRGARCKRWGGSNRMPSPRSPSRVIARCCSAGCTTSRRAASPEATAIARKSIVTKTGDGGETGLLYGGRVSKTDPRTEAYGAVDEAISALGVARALIKDRGRHATSRLEVEIDDLERRVPLPDAFVIPGGTPAAAALDVARAVLRRAERRIVGLQQAGQLRNPEVVRYANRLSDLLFMLARAEEGSAVKPLTGLRAVRTPVARARTRPAPKRRPRG